MYVYDFDLAYTYMYVHDFDLAYTYMYVYDVDLAYMYVYDWACVHVYGAIWELHQRA